jgi:hypothetical protein
MRSPLPTVLAFGGPESPSVEKVSRSGPRADHQETSNRFRDSVTLKVAVNDPSEAPHHDEGSPLRVHQLQQPLFHTATLHVSGGVMRTGGDGPMEPSSADSAYMAEPSRRLPPPWHTSPYRALCRPRRQWAGARVHLLARHRGRGTAGQGADKGRGAADRHQHRAAAGSAWEGRARLNLPA